MALALAAAVTTSGTLATLNDTELLDRLFLVQRRSPDVDLRRVARVASLAYAFVIDGNTEEGELAVLSRLVGLPPALFHEKIVVGMAGADQLPNGSHPSRGLPALARSQEETPGCRILQRARRAES